MGLEMRERDEPVVLDVQLLGREEGGCDQTSEN
jgi:hypothetical protein